MNRLESDELDPRVQIELESLNICTDEINRLEIQLDEANAQFRNALSESTHRLKTLSSRLGKCIEKARPYYDAVEIAKKAQLECQKAAVQFQRAASLHATAKETIALAESKFLSRQEDWQFDTAWQEMLNHATTKVMEADAQRAASEYEHQQRALFFNKAKETVQQLEVKLKSVITKSKPYFDTKDAFHKELQLLKERVQGLQKAVVQAKQRYAQSLRNLEIISEQIHQRRNMQSREPGVGAEHLDLSCLTLDDLPKPSSSKEALSADDIRLHDHDGRLSYSESSEFLCGSSKTSIPCTSVSSMGYYSSSNCSEHESNDSSSNVAPLSCCSSPVQELSVKHFTVNSNGDCLETL